MSFKIFLILTIFISASVYAHQLSNVFSDSQIKRIFHRSRDALPNYKITNLKTSKTLRSKKETRPVEFEVDGEKTQLNLRPSNHNSLPGNTPVWTVETDHRKSTGHTYNKLDQKEVKYDGAFYEDQQKMATLLAYKKDRRIFYDGLFGEGYLTKVVRSVPETWLTAPGNESDDNPVVFDVDLEKTRTVSIVESTSLPDDDKLDKPLDIFYPKLLVVVEYNYFKALAEDISETIKYVATFWNAVNLKYSKIAFPKINVMISGVIIAKDDTALKYIYEARNQSDMDSVDHKKLSIRGSAYFRQEFQKEVDFKNYDSTITMTNLRAGVAEGSAYLGRICSPSLNVGFVKDDSNFSGVFAATHELGHLLNLPHDGEGSAKICRSYPKYKIGTIMAPYILDVKEYVWSECSKKILREFSTMKAAECMKYPYRI